MTKRALITAEVYPETVAQLEALGYEVSLAGWGQTRQAMSEQELITRLTGVHLLMVEVEQVTADVIAAASVLELIHVCRAKPTIVDLEAATARGIAVLSAPGRNADSVADFTIALLLNLARNINRAERHLRSHGWLVEGELPYFHFRGPELEDKTIGLVGCGAIGRAILRRLHGFGVHVLIYDPYLPRRAARSLGELVLLDELMHLADFVLVLCALTEETRAMIAEEQLGLMKPTAYLINTARAAVVEEQALFNALQAGKIAGAALDVFWKEPLSPESEWLCLENVLLTPHLGGAADDVRKHQGNMLLEDLRALRAGETPARLANPQALGKKSF